MQGRMVKFDSLYYRSYNRYKLKCLDKLKNMVENIR